MFGYIPLGMAFGVLFSQLGLSWGYALFAAVVVYAGAAQFMAVGLLAAGAGLAEVFISTLLLNMRHLVYGLSLLDRYPTEGTLRWYLIFGLTDETYALVTSQPIPDAPDRSRFYGWLTLFNQSYWVIGCTLGAFVGTTFGLVLEGLEFTLVALFVVLLMEQWARVQQLLPFALAALVSVCAWWWSPEHFLLIALAGCLVSLPMVLRTMRS